MKLINIISVCIFLMIGVSAFAEGDQVEQGEVVLRKREDVSLRKKLTRTLSRMSMRTKAPLKVDEKGKIDNRKTIDGVRLPSFDQYQKEFAGRTPSDRNLRRVDSCATVSFRNDSSKCSSVSSDRSSKSSADSWTSTSESFTSWPTYTSDSSMSLTSTLDSSDSTSSSDTSKNSDDSSTYTGKTEDVKPVAPEVRLQYDYMDDAFIDHVIKHNFRYVWVGTGWSESSMGKMNVNNQEKQKRAFALSYMTAAKIDRQDGKAHLIYLTTAPVNPHYRRYLYRLANKQKISRYRLKETEVEDRFRHFEHHSLSIVYFSPKERDRNAEDVTAYLSQKSNRYRQIKLPKALNRLREDIYTSNHFVGFTAHFSGPYLEQLAKKWNLPYLVNPSAQAHWIKKSRSRQSFRDAGVNHPRGTYEPAFSVDELTDEIYKLLSQLSYKKIILKLDQSAAGYGNKVMKFDEITDDLTEEAAKALIRKRFDDREIFPEFFIGRIEEEDGGAIVEEFIDCKNYASPASIYMINGLDDVNMRYTYDQLLGGKDNQVFQGSIGPIQVNQNYAEGDLVAMSRKVGIQLSRYGVRGNVGTDFVTCDVDDSEHPNRKAWAIENNVRMTGTSYPYYTLQTLVGKDKIKGKFMKSFDDVKIPIIAFREYRLRVQRDFYMSFLPRNKDTINPITARGCIIHNDTFRLGKIGVACLADSRQEVSDMYDRFAASIYNFIDQHDATNEYRNFIKLNGFDLLKKSMFETKKTMEQLIRLTDQQNPVLGQGQLLSKQIDIIYENGTFVDDKQAEYGKQGVGMELKPEARDREFQQKFFNEYAFSHPMWFNPETNTGCMINSDLFKLKHLGMVCAWDKGEKPEAFMSFFDEVKQQIFVVSDNESDGEETLLD